LLLFVDSFALFIAIAVPVVTLMISMGPCRFYLAITTAATHGNVTSGTFGHHVVEVIRMVGPFVGKDFLMAKHQRRATASMHWTIMVLLPFGAFDFDLALFGLVDNTHGVHEIRMTRGHDSRHSGGAFPPPLVIIFLMKRARSSTQLTLKQSVEHYHASRFLPFPEEIMCDQVMAQLGDDLYSLANLALTCHTFYSSSWRRHFNGNLTIQYVWAWKEDPEDSEEMKELRSMWARNPVHPRKQEVFDTIAPYITTLRYYLPCHHGWSPMHLEKCTKLAKVTFIGNDCYGGDWETPLPVSITHIVFRNLSSDAIAKFWKNRPKSWDMSDHMGISTTSVSGSRKLSLRFSANAFLYRLFDANGFLCAGGYYRPN
jgi:hypothetical protein